MHVLTVRVHRLSGETDPDEEDEAALVQGPHVLSLAPPQYFAYAAVAELLSRTIYSVIYYAQPPDDDATVS